MATRVRYCELVLKPCSRTYGSSPCTAAVGTTGDRKCYNSPATCQDPANFLSTEQVVRWAVPTGDLPIDIDAIPSIDSISITPQKLAPGENSGIRAGLQATFKNHRHNDVGFDKYLADRGFNPFTKGTFWPKFSARWPNIKGFEFRDVHGYVGQDINDMQRYYFVVDSTSGPNNSGGYAINAKDAISFLEGDKAVAPAQSPGILLADITDSATTLTLTPSGIGASYPSSGLASMGDESVTYTRSGDVITLTARGVSGSKASTHEAGTTFQVALRFIAQDPADIINTLLGFTDLPADYYDYAVWLAETTDHVGRLYSADIMKPTPVKKLLDDLILDVGLNFWADISAKKIRVKALRNVAPLTVWDDDVFLPGSVNGSYNEGARVSELLIYYGQKNPLRKIDEEENFKAILNVEYSDARTALEESPPAIRKMYSRFITVGNRAAANAVGAIITTRYGRAPKDITFNLPLLIKPELGSTVSIKSRVFEDDQGDIAPEVPYLLTRIQPNITHFAVQAEQINLPLAAPSGTRYVYIDITCTNITLKALHDAIYVPAVTGDVIVFVFSPTVIAGSSSGSFSVVLGTGWASGVDITLDFIGGASSGRIQGKGGKGAYAIAPVGGGIGYGFGPTAGGPALYTRYPIKLNNSVVWSGGGGGINGSASAGETWGGGGAGFDFGEGGASGHGISTATSGGSGGYTGSGSAGSTGGGPGLAGASGGAAAGTAIDGVSYCTFTGTSDIRGATIN